MRVVWKAKPQGLKPRIQLWQEIAGDKSPAYRSRRRFLAYHFLPTIVFSLFFEKQENGFFD